MNIAPRTFSAVAVYLSPLTIGVTTTLRARVLLANYPPTNTDTETYLFLSDVLTQSNGPAGWPAAGVNLSNPSKEATHWGNAADADSDGSSNLAEFMLGSSPVDVRLRPPDQAF